MEKIITGKNISLRLVNIEDAEFIVNLRTKKGAFLSTTSPDISQQKEWLLLYKEREKLKEMKHQKRATTGGTISRNAKG